MSGHLNCWAYKNTYSFSCFNEPVTCLTYVVHVALEVTSHSIFDECSDH